MAPSIVQTLTPKKSTVRAIKRTIKVPFDYIINRLKGDEKLPQYLSQDDMTFIYNLINETEFPSHIDSVDEVIESVGNIVKTYLDNKNAILTISATIVVKYVSQKIKSIINQYHVATRRLRNKKAAKIKRLSKKSKN